MFRAAVAQVVSSPPQDCVLEPCPDQYVGTFAETLDVAGGFSLRQGASDAGGVDKRVILVLESPHCEEFKKPIGPAKGPTGRLIRSHLSDVLEGRSVGSFGLFLVNAIQNQCSLGLKPNEYRDVVFLSAWKLYGRENFIQRLTELVKHREALIINACTKGNSKKLPTPLRVMVEEAILAATGRPSDLRITHPASWAHQRNRRAIWQLCSPGA